MSNTAHNRTEVQSEHHQGGTMTGMSSRMWNAPTTRPATCTNPNHDHLEIFDEDGDVIETPTPMVCTECRAPLHYDVGAELYVHDDPELKCWLHRAMVGDPAKGVRPIEGATPCNVPPAPVTR